MKNKKLILCFDLDNVICTTKNKNYSQAVPKKKIIKFINNLYDNNYEIKIFTGRYMGRNKDNINKTYKQGYLKVLSQIKKWGIKFDKLILGKPSFDYFVDDRAIGFSKNWPNNLKKILKKNEKNI